MHDAAKTVRQTAAACGVLAALMGAGALGAPGDPNWPQFRGPGSAGVSLSTELPERWSKTENVAWVIDVPGRGWSSPIVWGGRVFVTSAVTTGAYKAPSTGIFGNDYVAELEKQGLSEEEILKRLNARDIESSDETQEIDYLVMAIDAATGKTVWRQTAHHGKPFGGRHRKNSYASETPSTDGERVYAYFGNIGLFCYTLDGKLLWTHRWPPQPIYLNFGTASSPVVFDGRVYVQHDNDAQSWIAALDAKTGRELWQTARTEGNGPLTSGWSTPFVWRHAMRTEIIALGRTRAISYDVNGKELWRLGGLTGQATPTPVAADGLLYVGTGSQGESNRPIFAVKPGAAGDITLPKGESSNAFVAWTHPRASAYTSSPLVYNGRMYVINDNGILTVFDAKTGKEIYKARAGGGGFTFSASPWAANDRVFMLSEDGDAIVIEAGDQYKEIAKNSLEEMSFATPALAGDSLFIRTATKLYHVRKAPRPSASR